MLTAVSPVSPPPKKNSPSGWAHESSDGGGVPAGLFVRAMTSLAPHYRDDPQALEAHLREEHAIFAASENRGTRRGEDGSGGDEDGGGGGGGSAAAGTRRAHLCCADYRDGPAAKGALEAAAGGRGFVRTALNSHAHGGGGGGGYCAVAHVSSAVAARMAGAPAAAAAAAEPAAADRAVSMRCSPLTHASKEPLSLLAPSSEENEAGAEAEADAEAEASAAALFGLSLGPAVRDGPGRGLVVTLSPGSLPKADEQPEPADAAAAAAAAAAPPAGNTRGGSAKNRDLSSSTLSRPSSSSSSPAELLEEAWRAAWGGARGREGAAALAETVPWTAAGDLPAGGQGGGGRRSLLADDSAAGASGGQSAGSGGGGGRDRGRGDGSLSRARRFHGRKAAGYRAVIDHLGEKMERIGAAGAGVGGATAGRGEGSTLAKACGWESNLVFVHARHDLLYLR